MSKSKWTKHWVERTRNGCPVDVDETVRGELHNGIIVVGRVGNLWWPNKDSQTSIIRYKRLKKNVKAEKTRQSEVTFNDLLESEAKKSIASEALFSNGSQPQPPQEDNTPKPVITGPGEYVTKDRRKTVIFGKRENTFRPWLGEIEGCREYSAWCENGEYSTLGCHKSDIIGPWVEPKTKTVVSDDEARAVAMAGIAASNNPDRDLNDIDLVVARAVIEACLAFRNSHTVEEE